jgi:CMP-N,N'-diacetyllegionaminic acid synthase
LKNIAFIPVKGSSEGIPKKNLQKIGRLTLAEWSYQFALQSQVFDEIVISTESQEVIEQIPDLNKYRKKFEKAMPGSIINTISNVTIHKRESKFAHLSALTVDLMYNYFLNTKFHQKDRLIVLQPTSPFRSFQELKEIIDLSSETQGFAVVSSKIFDSPHPDKRIRLKEKSIINFDNKHKKNLTMPRQSLESYYVLDGAYYCIDVKIFMEFGLLTDPTYAYIRAGLNTINIDSIYDLEFARFIFTEKKEMLSWIPSSF